jgi:hypothetical protein
MIKRLAGLGALVSFGICLAAPVLFFYGRIGESGYKLAFNLASIGWFVFATGWMAGRRKRAGS